MAKKATKAKATKAKATKAKAAKPKATKAKATKATKAKAVATTLGGTVMAFVKSFDVYMGAVEVGDASLSILTKKPKSSKYENRVFPLTQVISYTEGEDGYVNVFGRVDALAGEIRVNDIQNDIVWEEGFVTITDSNGDVTVVVIGPDTEVVITSDPTDETGSGSGKPAKKAATKSKKAAKVEEEEEADEEEEDEDEEDEEEADEEEADEEDEDEEDEDEDEDDEEEEDEDEDEEW